MKHPRVSLSGAVVVVSALALTSCGSGSAQDRAVPADASVCATPGAGSTDPSVVDGSVDVAAPDGRGRVRVSHYDYVPGTTSATFLAGFPAIAVVEVVARDKPLALAYSQNFAVATDRLLATEPRANRSVQKFFGVVRPATFQVVETVRGTLARCLDLAVPGGSIGAFTEDTVGFPTRFAVGDRLLALFGKASPPSVSYLVSAQQDGSFLLPFGEKVADAATWELPAYVPPSPPPKPGMLPPGVARPPDAARQPIPGVSVPNS